MSRPEPFVTKPSHRHHPEAPGDSITRMNKTLTTITAAAVLLGALTACSSGDSQNSHDPSGQAGAPNTKTLDASSAFTEISGKVGSAKLSGTVTAENDPNHLLGRPSQYTSKITFTDGRIKASDVSGTKEGDIERGGAIEVFADAVGATARAKYIQAVTKSMPALAEYDYVHGAIVVRVSHYLTPAQAAGYKSAADGLG